jgi:hypothetical protein
MCFSLELLHVVPESPVQLRRQFHQPGEEPEQLLHDFPGQAALVEAAHQPQLPDPPMFRIRPGLEGLQVRRHHGRKRVRVLYQCGFLTGVVEELADRKLDPRAAKPIERVLPGRVEIGHGAVPTDR